MVTGRALLSGNRFEVSAQYIGANDNATIWADRYDLDVGGLFKIAGKMCENILAKRDRGRAPFAEQCQAASKSGGLGTLSSRHGLFSSPGPGDFTEAARLFEQALKKDAGFARALAGLAYSQAQNWFFGFGADMDRVEVLAAARKAVALDGDDALARLALGRALWVYGDVEQQPEEYEEALRINLSSALTHHNLGTALVHLGAASEAVRHMRLAILVIPALHLDPSWRDQSGG